jgi:class 3 adenylate cyclase
VPGAWAEYKQVTVLFADVVASMDVAAAVGAERLREIMTELVTSAAAVVQRYGGTIDKFTGDGIMALFGAPAALEDHALRACLAALDIQDAAKQLAVEVDRQDGVDLPLRVGLNSGQVVVGESGSLAMGYTAIGEQVGIAHRMESIAAPGTVMLSASTARLVEGAALLGQPKVVRIKGVDRPVCARRLLGMSNRRRAVGCAGSNLVGRQWQMAALKALLERAIHGHGAVVGVVGSPGIGKSRLVREVTRMAHAAGVDVFSAFCESYASDIPFNVVARLLRAAAGVVELDGSAAREQAQAGPPDAEPADLLLFEDLLGIADTKVRLPKIDPDARRRRLTALINAASLAREAPAVYVIEDAHWIDEVSASMLSEFAAVVPQTSSLVLITYRPEYRGALSAVTGTRTITLAPLSDAQTAALAAELLGPDPSVAGLVTVIAERAAGNPFFAEEMVRDLTERGLLGGNHGNYVSTADVDEVGVPATLQATIAARIDRLAPPAKRTLSAAAVIGSQFSLGLLRRLVVDPVLEDLAAGGLIDQIAFTGQPKFRFHHPLIHTVAYQAQLKTDRAQLHRRVAAALESCDAGAVDENAALIAEHLEAAGDLRAAYGWHMRAAAWATNRDIAAARRSWERARMIADAVPDDDPARAALRIAPRTMLCGIAWRVDEHVASCRFEELRQLCTATGDRVSLAIAMAGLVVDRVFQDRLAEASQLASETWALIESLGDASLTVGLAFAAIYAKLLHNECCDALRWSQTVIDLADGDPSQGNVLLGAPLALAFTSRGDARYSLGHPGWRDDLRHGLAMARCVDPLSYATVVTYVYSAGIPIGVLSPDDAAMCDSEDALRIAERAGDDLAVAVALMTLGLTLVHCHTDGQRERGQQLLAQARDLILHQGHNLCDLALVDVYSAREKARGGDRDAAIERMRAAVDHLFREGRLLAWGIPATGVFVETLLDRGTEADMAAAETAIELLATAPADDGLMTREIWLLRLQALLARARGDSMAYQHFRDRYRGMAKLLDFDGHRVWAEAMP